MGGTSGSDEEGDVDTLLPFSSQKRSPRHYEPSGSSVYMLLVRLPFRKSCRHRYLVTVLSAFLVFCIALMSGLVDRLLQESYSDDSFVYPLNVPNFRYLIENVKMHRALVARNGGMSDGQLDNILQGTPKPLNNFTFNYVISSHDKCNDSLHQPHSSFKMPITLLIMVKSAVANAELRAVIRRTWGYEQRFSDIIIRTVFMLGQCDPLLSRGTMVKYELDCQRNIDLEQKKYGDLIQADFLDSYYNNTLKTMAILEWVSSHCSQVPFTMFVDDDFYVSIKNLFRFLRGFLNVQTKDDTSEELQSSDKILSPTKSIHYDGRLYFGYVFPYSRPMRHWFSKWYISRSDYPYSHYPPYVTGGFFVMNNQSVVDMHHAARYTAKFKYDDVYLGIVAKKMAIHLVHNENVYFYKFPYKESSYGNVIASHGYADAHELIQVWQQQKELGHA